ncbi:MFS transporter [Kiloniella laminariae]|uniref:MFS transporter n=1 Tax=Kiloniella laminariae TaxID=454162 RepID=A0ABT4LMV3_9PROT|nr:MFS transporter [Kiloniella laminariae]MCZ4282446.1 MFS transporter [Kiloniella laminariae]
MALDGQTGRGATLLIAVMCLSQVLGMLDNATFSALIVLFQKQWSLSNTEIGWISGIYYGGYAAAVPFLVALTDREDARRIYLFCMALGGFAAVGFAWFAGGFWSAMAFRLFAGVSLAGTYMVGLKLLTDLISEKKQQSRAVAYYTAHFAIGTGVSVFVAGEVWQLLGWQWSFLVAGIGSFFAWIVVLLFVAKGHRPSHHIPLHQLIDFRPVIANRPALGYILAYAAHLWELFALRAWLVAFFVFSLSLQPDTAYDWSPTQIASWVFLLGLPASVIGNEFSVRFGRRRLLTLIMGVSALVGFTIGFTASLPFVVVIAAFTLYGITATADSSSLTSGVVANSDPARKGATMALQSLAGFAAGSLSPIVFGAVLDLAGGAENTLAWVAAFSTMGVGVLLGPVFIRYLGRTEPLSKGMKH